MNNNTKSKFKLTTRRSRSTQVAKAEVRNEWNRYGKVAGKAKQGD